MPTKATGPPRKTRKAETDDGVKTVETLSVTGSPQSPPNQTLYVQNLNDKITKEELRRSLYLLFSTYGHLVDIVALKTSKMRGQAHIAFGDLGSATLALKNLQGFNFYGKDLKIDYAKSKSNAISKLDGTYRMPPPPALKESTLPLAPFEQLGAKRAHPDGADY